MDKTRFTGMNILSYFNPAPKAVSVNEAAEELVKDLVGMDPAPDMNSSAHHTPGAETGARALAALQLLHGREPLTKDGLPATKETFRDAKQAYLLQSGEKNDEKAAVDFDRKVEKLLVAKLSCRMRLFYAGKVKDLDQSVARGEITKGQADQELNLYIDEVKDPEHCLFQTEVRNALSIVGGREPNVVNGLCFLFKGKLRPEQEKRLALFDTVLNEIVENKFASSNVAPVEATKFRRAFVAEARRQLGSRLSEGFSAEYFAKEKCRRDEMENGKISYDDYAKSMRNWIATRNLQRQVGSVLGNLNDRDNVIALLSWVNYQKNGVPIRPGNPYCKHPHLREQCRRFSDQSHLYSESHSLGLHEENSEYTRFLNEAERRLAGALPADIKKALNNHKKDLEALVASQYISEVEVNKNQLSYFSSLVSGEDNEKSLVFNTTADHPGELMATKSDAVDLVRDGLSESFRESNREKDVLEALIMCWGGFVNNHHEEFSLYPLCEAKNEYLSIGKKHPSGETLVSFNFDNDFSIEARRQLVDFLPDEVRTLYREREELLSEYYEKNMINGETFRKSMESFLRPYFEKKET